MVVEHEEKKSKSQLKRDMTALQSLGEHLMELSPDQIGKIEMPEELQEAVLFAKTLRRGEAKRRQMQYVGVLMRRADPEPIRKALDDIHRGRRMEAHLFRKLEGWRDGLIDGNETVLEEIVNIYPLADRQRIHRLVLNARKELEANKPPKSSKALFRYLRDLSKYSDRTASTDAEIDEDDVNPD